MPLASESSQASAKAAGVAFQMPSEEYLFVRRARGDHAGTWAFPGGTIEDGETPEQAAAREVGEETGWLIDPETLRELVGVTGGYNTYRMTLEEPFIPALNEEHDDYVWAHSSNPPQPLHPGVVEMLFFSLNPRRDEPYVEYEAESSTRDHFTPDGNYFAPLAIGKKRRLTPHGTLIIEDVGLARTGTMVYTAKDLPNLEPDESGRIVVERTAEEVFHPDAIASFEGVPVTLFHPPEFVRPDNWKTYAVGHVQNVRRGEGPDSDLLKGDIIVEDAAAIQYVNLNLPQNSCGYDAQYKQAAPGRASQHTIRGNHSAIVPVGRAGPRCAITDEDTNLYGDVMNRESFWARAHAFLAGKGLRPQDVTQLRAATEDALTEPPIVPIAQPTADAVPAWATALDAKLSRVADWQKAYDEGKAEEERQEQEAKDKKTSDEEEERKKREKEDEEERTGDTLIEAESPGTVISLGKVWNGLTGDAGTATVDHVTEINSRAEILTPGIHKVSREQIRGTRGAVLASHLREVLTRAATVDAASVAPFTMGQPISKLAGVQLVAAFTAASNLAKIRNNAKGRAVAAPGKRPTTDAGTHDGQRPVNPVKSYKEAMEGYAKDKDKTAEVQ